MSENYEFKKMYELYLEGVSLEKIGKKYGKTRHSVYGALKREGYVFTAKKILPSISYDNKRFTMRNHGYYGGTSGERELLHRYKYKKEIGDIPSDWDVHHIDHDKENNDIDNLLALPKDVHAKLFSTGSNKTSKGNRQYQIEVQEEIEYTIKFYLELKLKAIAERE